MLMVVQVPKHGVLNLGLDYLAVTLKPGLRYGGRCCHTNICASGTWTSSCCSCRDTDTPLTHILSAGRQVASATTS
jgi:hypothetical protein